MIMISTAAPDLPEYSDHAPDHLLTVPQAAAALGISERTLRKRIKAGEIEARKYSMLGGGLSWRVSLPDRTGSEMETEPEARRKIEPEANRKYSECETIAERKRAGSEMENGTEISEPRTGSGTEAESTPEYSRQIERLESEVLFLRGLVEQRDRDAAEMRAALREALRSMPKAIEAGSQSTPDQPRETVPREGQSTPTPKTTPAQSSGTQRPAAREMRPLWKVMLGIR
jgi:excisionase family DNA binding protein